MSVAETMVGFFGDERSAVAAIQDLIGAGFLPDDVWMEREARAVRVSVKTDATRSARAADIMRRYDCAA
jgi:hypothetical protein